MEYRDMGTALMLAKVCLSTAIILLLTIIFQNVYVFLGSWFVVPPLVFFFVPRK
jgi:hypothetical protein